MADDIFIAGSPGCCEQAKRLRLNRALPSVASVAWISQRISAKHRPTIGSAISWAERYRGLIMGRIACCSLLFKHFLKQRLGPFQSFLREDHRFHLADGIVDHALVVQAAEHVPIESFPGPVAVVQR